MYVAVTNDVRGTPPTRVNNNTVLVGVLEDYLHNFCVARFRHDILFLQPH